jgi:hypothetical protein
MNQIIYNSFPRSGNVYSGSVSRYFFYETYATVHIPEIFSVKELDNVTIFRKPEDAIASLINKQAQSSVKLEKERMEQMIHDSCNLYKTYMSYAKTNKDLIYIGKFEDLISNTVNHFENIAKKFKKNLVPDYQSNFKNAEFLGKLWDDRYDGHIPRPKDEVRIDIEDRVKLSLPVKELNKEYKEFISNFATKSGN